MAALPAALLRGGGGATADFQRRLSASVASCAGHQPALAKQAGQPGGHHPTVKLRCEGESLDVRSLSPIIEAAEWLGVPFNCKNAECGHCRVAVVGCGRVCPPNPREKAFLGKDMDGKMRLGCQMKLWGDTEIERISLSA
ncbi:hypothetical protein DIPPA_14000 [Diplonema papillatum]|nr:hypothetical protein DIPPA_14000 [Diplonema papillatum]